MEIDEALEFVRANPRGVLVTRGAGDHLQTSPVVAGVDADGRLAISSRETAYKVKNLMKDPRATYCAFTNQFFGGWAQIDGTAEMLHLPEAMEPLVEYYRAVSGEHPDWDDYRAAMERERRVLIVVRPERAGPSRSG
jgi:PPOX class probable F420-dependent enzyme